MPNTTTIYNTDIPGNQNLVWLLIPSEGKIPAVKTKMLSQTSDGVKLEVTVKGKTWKITIPFDDSTKVRIAK